MSGQGFRIRGSGLGFRVQGLRVRSKLGVGFIGFWSTWSSQCCLGEKLYPPTVAVSTFVLIHEDTLATDWSFSDLTLYRP